MDIVNFVAEKTNTNESMWQIQEEKNIDNGQEYSLSCSTGKEVVLKIFKDNTYELTTYGQIRNKEA